MFEFLIWLFVLMSIFGAILNANKKISGFYVWFFANSALLIINVILQIYAQAFLFLVFNIINVYGIRKWKKEKNEKEK